MSHRPLLRIVKSEPPPDRPFVADYTRWWRLPPPLPRRRLPLGSMIVLAVVIVLALCLAVLAGDGSESPPS